MVTKSVGVSLALSVALVLILAGCSGRSDVIPAVNPGGPALPVAVWAPDAAGPIVYNGPKVSKKPEVDLYSTTPTAPGYSAKFTLTQKGGSGAFTYAFNAVSSFTNNCPKTANVSYAISPASGKKAKKGKYTVKATAKGTAGACMVTFTGASKKTLKLMLTFTTSGVVINTPPSTR